ncbi:type II secretion system F family protein [Virgibacillus siamensis]|uniref:type II secretion system F family protein n=1 Tax=Virgibacillus siamensis TaxID=480071 RepID=UPI000987C523|nr:type II secretion system F family protein [Virgibacillus siamensis]
MGISMRKFFWLGKNRNKAISKDLQMRFLKQMSRLLKNGYPLLEALEIIKWDKQLKPSAASVITLLKDGSSFDEALEKANCFSPSVTSYLYFVRANGDIQQSIDKCVSMFEQRMRYSKKFQETIRYPIILFFVFALLIYFVKQSVLPSFIDIFQNNAGTASTAFISVIVIDFITKFMMVSVLLLIAGFVFAMLVKRKIGIEKQIILFRSIPIYRKYKKLHTSFLFATHFSSLLKTGMPIKEILSVMERQNKLPILAHFSKLMTDELNKGVYITNLLENLPLIDKQIAVIFQKNADVHALEKDLDMYASVLTEELNRKIMKILTYLQPAFFLTLAGFIVLIYVTLMWPMFQLIQTI